MVQNDADSGPGRLVDWLQDAGIALDIHHGYADPNLPTRLEHQALIVLGGGFLPDADDRAAWLAPTRELARQAIDTGTPYLGLCLGGQLLAHVAGGAVTGEVGAPENGSTAITLRDTASDDPLFHELPGEVNAIEHHVDAITTLPPSAMWLAESARCPYQALRVGERAWGTQFHPEISPDRVRAWKPDRLREQGFDPDEVYAKAVADDPIAKRIWQTVVERFASIVLT